MNTTKAIIILVVFSVGLVLGYNYFIKNSPAQEENSDNLGMVLPPEQVAIPTGETGEALGVSITLNDVVQDVRCPVDVQCIEAGAINTSITVSVDGKEETFFYASDGVPLSFEDYEISIVAVSPELVSTKIINSDDYVVTFNVASKAIDFVDILEELPYYDPAGGTVETGKTSDQLCVSFGGEWSVEFSECLGISGEMCAEIGGTWNECASACRNNPNAEICTMQCVQVCEFKGIPLEAM